jgi:hypothetical protein
MNLLDLGIWCSLQSFVEKMHRGHRSDAAALARTIEKTWTDEYDSEVFKKVYARGQKVLQLVIDDNGGNTKVDSHRRELLVPIGMPPDSLPEEDGDDVLPDEEEQDESSQD